MRRYRKGQVWRPPSAAEHAASADSIEGFKRRSEIPQDRQFPLDGNQVIVENDSGSDQDLGAVLAITNTNPLTNIDRDYPWVTGDSLDSSNRYFPLCVLVDPLPDGAFGPALVSGIAVANVNVGATWHRRAYPSGNAVLASGIFGPFEILSELTSTGAQLVLCSIGAIGNRGIFAKSTTSISSSSLTSGRLTLGSGTVTIFDPYSTSGQYSDASHTLTAYNMAGESIDSGTYLLLQPADDWLPLATMEPCTAPT